MKAFGVLTNKHLALIALLIQMKDVESGSMLKEMCG